MLSRTLRGFALVGTLSLAIAVVEPGSLNKVSSISSHVPKKISLASFNLGSSHKLDTSIIRWCTESHPVPFYASRTSSPVGYSECGNVLADRSCSPEGDRFFSFSEKAETGPLECRSGLAKLFV